MHYILVVLSLFLRNRGLWRPASVFSMWCDVMWCGRDHTLKTLKLAKHRTDKDLCQHFFSEPFVNRWNQLINESVLLIQYTVETSSLNFFQESFWQNFDWKGGLLWTSVCRAIWLELSWARFNVLPNIQVILGMGLWVKRHNQQCQSTEGREVLRTRLQSY